MVATYKEFRGFRVPCEGGWVGGSGVHVSVELVVGSLDRVFVLDRGGGFFGLLSPFGLSFTGG